MNFLTYLRYSLPTVTLCWLLGFLWMCENKKVDSATEALAICRETRRVMESRIDLLKIEANMAKGFADQWNKKEAETQQELSKCLEINVSLLKGCVQEERKPNDIRKGE